MLTQHVDRSDRVRIEVGGPDRAKVLHNLTTNDIKRLGPGSGREAFVTTGQGKTIALVTIHAVPDRLLVRSDPGTAPDLLAHFGKYGLFDDATFVDISASTAEWHLIGPEVDARLEGLGLTVPRDDLATGSGRIADVPVLSIRESPAGSPGVTLIFGNRDVDALRAALPLPTLDASAFDALRIAAGTPVAGRDLTAANLPQELGRDARAISFVKGCYLGQETVARLDALGHVNKILVGFQSENGGQVPPGSAIEAEGKPVGTVTSSAEGVALGYVKVAQAEPGTKLVAVTSEGPVGLTVRGRSKL